MTERMQCNSCGNWIEVDDPKPVILEGERIESYLRGHKIEMHNGEWVFSDTKESTVETWQKRPCGHCGKHNTPEGHDGCLGTLKGVMNACCGHGQVNDAYVQFLDGFSIHGKDAITIMQILKKYS